MQTATPESSGTDGNIAQNDQMAQNNVMYVRTYCFTALSAPCHLFEPATNRLHATGP